MRLQRISGILILLAACGSALSQDIIHTIRVVGGSNNLGPLEKEESLEFNDNADETMFLQSPVLSGSTEGFNPAVLGQPERMEARGAAALHYSSLSPQLN